MTKLVITQTKENNIKESVSRKVITKLYSIGKDDDTNYTLTSGVDTTNEDRPITTVSGSISAPGAYETELNYIQNKYPNLDVTVSYTYIQFEDSAVENAVKSFLNKDGISSNDAQRITYNTIWRGSTDIQTFPEFKLFTYLNEHGCNFQNCSNLTSIDLSECSFLLDGLFQNCTSLIKADLRRNSLINSSNLLTIPKNSFNGCSNLKELHLPKTVTTLGEAWVKNCNSLEKVTGLDSITSHDANNWQIDNRRISTPVAFFDTTTPIDMFRGNGGNSSAYNNSLFYPNITYTTGAPDNYWYGNPKITAFTYINGQMNIGLLYYEKITDIGLGTFYRCSINNLVINNITPPTYNSDGTDLSSSMSGWWGTWGNNMFGNAYIGTIWVPDSAVSTYESDSRFTGKTIKGINETDPNTGEYLLPRYDTLADWEAAAAVCEANGTAVPVALIREYVADKSSVVLNES